MPQTESLTVIDAAEADDEPTSQQRMPTEIDPIAAPERYGDADQVDLRDYEGAYSFPRFVTAVCDAIGKDYGQDDARVLDAMPETTDINFGILLVFPDEMLLFVGSDPTANDAIPWYAFAIEPMEPVPTPTTAQDALDLLKPPAVRDHIADDGWIPDRHGEWWLLPTTLVPAGSVYQPGVSSRPFGASPLGNHVPREYAFTVQDDEFMERFEAVCPDAPTSIKTPTEVIQWTRRQLRKATTPEYAPSWADIRHCADEVLVRGTVRHRDNDHFVEKLGDQWHRALTHDFEVYTGDGVAEDVHLDYHGQ